MNSHKLKHFLQRFKIEVALLCSAAMVYGFLAGRAILSLGMFLFFLNAVWDTRWANIKQQKYWIWGLVWVAIYALSYCWSDDIPYWQERFQTKYAFVILPLAFGLLPPVKTKHLDQLTFALFILASAGCTYSLSFYFKDSESILRGYVYSKLFVTPAYKDHIRFSIFIAWCVLWMVFMYRKTTHKFIKTICVFSALFFVLYLHVLSARSGLLMLYGCGVLYVLFLFLRKKILAGVSLVLVLVALMLLSYQKIPSFKLKMQYVAYSYDQYKNGNRSVGYSDIGRIVSYQLAVKSIAENPIVGVGAGDVRSEMKHQYELHAPEVQPEQRIVPHNQFLEVLLAGGIVAFIPFVVWLLLPLQKVRRTRDGFYILATWLGLLFCMMVEAMLEVQFGVFVYLFTLLWIMKATETESFIPSSQD